MLSSLTVLATGFFLGFLHALDADHVMAVSALSNQKPKPLKTLKYSANWALGHGGILISAGVALFLMGWSLPEWLSRTAELSVGVLLMVLGALCIRQLRRRHLSVHHHKDSGVTHLHWHTDDSHLQKGGESTSHAPVMVGVVHGLAGSAPALAVIPAVTQGNGAVAIIYLVLFSVGVMLSMTLFGLGLGWLQRTLNQASQWWFSASQYLIATASIAFGGYWLLSAI